MCFRVGEILTIRERIKALFRCLVFQAWGTVVLDMQNARCNYNQQFQLQKIGFCLAPL